MKKKPLEELNLFDMIDKEDIKTDLSKCHHRVTRHSETVWPGETCIRLTMTCELCGKVRGRYPNE